MHWWSGNGGVNTNWNYNSGGTTNWGSASGVVDNIAPPTAISDVVFDAASPTTNASNISAAITIQSLDCNGYTGTLTHSATITLTVSGTANTILCRFSAGMTYTPLTPTRALALLGTGDFYSGGHTIGNLTITPSGAGINQRDALTTRQTATLTIAGTTYTTNNFAITTGRMTLTLTTLAAGTSTMTLTRSSWSYSTGETPSLASSTIVMTPTTGWSFAGGGYAYGTVNISGATVGAGPFTGTNTFAAFTYTANAAVYDWISFASNFTVTGTFSVSSSSNLYRVHVKSTTRGVQVVIDNSAGPSFAGCSNMDVEDIALTNGIDMSATDTGNCGGNGSNWGFKAGINKYWHKDAGSFASATQWFTQSNGAGSLTTPPLPQDTAVFDASSIDAANPMITLDIERLGSVVFTGCAACQVYRGLSTGHYFYGSVTLNSLLSLGIGLVAGFRGRGVYYFTSAGLTITANIAVDPLTGSLLLADALNMPSYYLGIISGTFDAGGYAVSVSTFAAVAGTTVTASGTWTVNGSGEMWGVGAADYQTFNNPSMTLNIVGGAMEYSFSAGDENTYGPIHFLAIAGGTYYFVGSGYFSTISFAGDGHILFDDEMVLHGNIILTGATPSGLYASSVDGGQFYSKGANVAQNATLSYWSSLTLSDATTGCTDGGNNAGWIWHRYSKGVAAGVVADLDTSRQRSVPKSIVAAINSLGEIGRIRSVLRVIASGAVTASGVGRVRTVPRSVEASVVSAATVIIQVIVKQSARVLNRFNRALGTLGRWFDV